MTKSQFSTLGAVLTLLLALHRFWPPIVSWWPPQHLFWPLVLLGGALGLLVPQKLPPILRGVASHREFGALFTAVVWAQFWLYGGLFWVLAALPLALAHWRGPGWNWKWSEFAPAQRRWLAGIVVGLVMLRLTWMTVSLQTAGMLTGGMQYGLNTYNYSTGYYDWGFQYNPLMNYLPGLGYDFSISGIQIRGGVWAALGCWLLLLGVARSDWQAKPGLKTLVGAILVWWVWQLLSGHIEKWPAWGFLGALGWLFYQLQMQGTFRPRSRSATDG